RRSRPFLVREGGTWLGAALRLRRGQRRRRHDRAGAARRHCRRGGGRLTWTGVVHVARLRAVFIFEPEDPSETSSIRAVLAARINSETSRRLYQAGVSGGTGRGR